MPSIVYTRRDHVIRILTGDTFATIVVEPSGGVRDRTSVDREIVDRAAAGDSADLRQVLEPMLAAASAQVVPTMLDRLVIEVGDRDWAAIPFESWLPAGQWLVRVSPTYPRVLQHPLVFPLRVLELGAPPVVAAAIEATFHGADREHAFVDATASLAEAVTFATQRKWRTVDILHVHELPEAPALLSTARADEPGTIGWLTRFAERFQTRLIVIDGETSQLPQLRVAAQTIIDRGGPAVWVFAGHPAECAALYGEIAHDRPLDWIRGSGVGGELFAGAGAVESLRYSVIGDELASQQTIEDIVRSVTSRISLWQNVRGRISLQPWLIRPILKPDDVISTVMQTAQRLRIPVNAYTIASHDLFGTRAERLADAISTHYVRSGFVVQGLDDYIRTRSGQGGDLAIDQLSAHVSANAQPLRVTRRAAANLLRSTMVRVRDEMPNYTFEDHESEGMLPLAMKVVHVQTIAEALGGERAFTKAIAAPREVNIAFAKLGVRGRTERLAQPTTRLSLVERVHVDIRISAKEIGLKSLGAMPFLEEAIEWSEDGAWIEIGVTGIDFTVLGDPVQEVWLPRHGPTERLLFAVQPFLGTVPGIARLRVAVYQRNNLIQSFLVAALLTTAETDPASGLARALNASVDDVRRLGAVGYLARLEYLTAPINAAASAAARGLTIIANDSAGDKVVTLKGHDLFAVQKDPLLPGKVERARQALEHASTRNNTYPYTFGGKINAGDPAELLDTLWSIADAGFDLFNTLVRTPRHQQQVRATVASEGGIHAAHIDAANVIPWSLVYDRKVKKTSKFYVNAADKAAKVYDVARGVCPASMPDEHGVMSKVACGGTKCLLNAADNDERKRTGGPIYLEETVICAQRFWGFTVPIEVPAQQVAGITNGEKTPPLARVIKARRPATVVGAFNPNLDFTLDHRGDLEGKVFVTQQRGSAAITRASLLEPAVRDNDALLQLLQQSDPEIVYLYCHALASVQKDGKSYGPALDFGKGYDGVIADRLEAKQFAVDPDAVWTRAPLVFINGCSSVGFSPYAPSEFIKQFIQGRHASAVVGAEVTVWEALATEMAKRFLLQFLDGQTSAGEALLQARRALLAMNNPLGLVYTLYGSANLKLAPPS